MVWGCGCTALSELTESLHALAKTGPAPPLPLSPSQEAEEESGGMWVVRRTGVRPASAAHRMAKRTCAPSPASVPEEPETRGQEGD